MNKEIIIEAKNLKKTFMIPHERHQTMKQAALNIFKSKNYTESKILKDVSFEIYKGEFFGIIGRNGSGKSTLLKMLAGIYTYDAGSLSINGRISPFLELGVGFSPELSGRENIYLSGAILGLTKKEVDERYDDIVSFSELTEFIDQKLKNYSSGMQVRLAFSVAIHAQAPIILLDEVLAVGDIAFQQKCFKVFDQMKKEEKTIVFVSHDIGAMEKYCDRVLLINDGNVVGIDKPKKILDEYRKIMGVEKSHEKNKNSR